MTTLWATVFVLGVLIFIHELGHFLAAKLSGIRVERFSLGYPPRLFGKRMGETDYCVSAIPFGGYVKIAGMVDESLDTQDLSEAPKPWEFRAKPWRVRFLVILAGPLMNLFLAYFIFVVGIFVYGVGEYDKAPIVGEVLSGRPAEAVGFRSGDRILTIDETPITSWDQMVQIIHAAPSRPLVITFGRDDTLKTVTVIPEPEVVHEKGTRRTIGLIGLGPVVHTRKAGFFEAFWKGGEQFVHLTRMIVQVVGKLVTGKESLRSLAGPVAIARMAGESARSGFGTLVGFLAMISLNLGILNLLPIPVLDGGHLLLLTIEGLIRRELPVKAKVLIQQVFMALLIGLMVFVVYNDILRLIRK